MLIDVARAFLDEEEWEYDSPRPEVIVTGVAGDHVQLQVFIASDEEAQLLAVFAVYPSPVPLDRRVQANEFLTRANYGLQVGNFELDIDDGEVRFKNAIDAEGMNLVGVAMRNLLFAAVSTADRYYPGLMRVIYGDISAADAIHEIEASEDAECEGEDHDHDHGHEHGHEA